MVLYEAAFAVVIAVTSPGNRATAILTITIIADFAARGGIPHYSGGRIQPRHRDGVRRLRAGRRVPGHPRPHRQHGCDAAV